MLNPYLKYLICIFILVTTPSCKKEENITLSNTNSSGATVEPSIPLYEQLLSSIENLDPKDQKRLLNEISKRIKEEQKMKQKKTSKDMLCPTRKLSPGVCNNCCYDSHRTCHEKETQGSLERVTNKAIQDIMNYFLNRQNEKKSCQSILDKCILGCAHVEVFKEKSFLYPKSKVTYE